ncbi:CaiB/BaiF CoA-transferase family protein [Cupriavidus sp. UME77]|uniref:CaiB/BaiF CoA transferase family protein n=1 Tax=Cupriavidus sp. UME77 TaxID=1862321 RepID=UPI0016015B79|nr:CoA transferase [Cupriavidus sp. UME77]MBB1633427.1 alpha-methylacyl-CoA racemase [Cupriavidus sp. UME77]
MRTMSARPPLDGITVIDFSELLPGPFLTQNLAELGARVIKIERPPHGDNARTLGVGAFEAVNRGKQSVLVDLKDGDQRAKVRDLIASADVLVEAYRPGVMARLGLDAASLHEEFPRLIYVSLSGYGQTGPWADLPGHDINYLAAAGVLAVSGTPGGAPAQSFGLPVADLCGAMYAMSSTLAALFQRQITGQGQHLDVSLADCALHWMNPRLGAYRASGAATLQEQRDSTLIKAAYGAFQCRDDNYLSIAALEDHFWKRLCAAIDLAPFGGEGHSSHKARKAVAVEINHRIAQVIRTMDSQEAFELLRQHDVPVAPVVTPTQLSTQPHFVSRDKFAQSDAMPLVNYPVPMSGVASADLGAAPALGSTGL